MQTFLPFKDFRASAATLDRQRLGKQRVECLQLLKGQWRNHPASLMWRDHEGALALYALAVCAEWSARGYVDTCADKIRAIVSEHPEWTTEKPVWLGHEPFHRAHRSNLLRKKQEHYAPLFEEGLPDDLAYLWPRTSC